MTATWIRAVASAGVAELVWINADGRPDAAAVTPLLLDDTPAVAFSYERAQTAREAGAAASIAVVLSDRRMAGRSWRPLAVIGRPRLVEDRDGELFTGRLLTEQLRKHPPSRALADSILLRREHWWFLPRLVVVIEPDAVIDIAERAAADGMLAVAEDDRLRVASVRCDPDGRLAAVDGTLPAQDGREHPAVVLRHDFSTDLERWPVTRTRGVLHGDTLRTTEPIADPVVPAPLSLLARLRQHRNLARACRRELAR